MTGGWCAKAMVFKQLGGKWGHEGANEHFKVGQVHDLVASINYLSTRINVYNNHVSSWALIYLIKG